MSKIAPNLYDDAIGWRAVARAAGKTREKRFPRGTTRKVITEWQEQARRDLRAEATQRTAAVPPGTFAEDVAAYLAPLKGTVLRDTRNLLAHWLDALPGVRRADLTVAMLRAVVVRWQHEGRAASTLNHRRRALIACLDVLDPDGVNPARKLPRVPAPAPELRAIDMQVASALVESLPDLGRREKGRSSHGTASKTKARLRVMLWTALPPATLARVQPADLDLDAGTLYVRPRRKGEGAPGMTLQLLPEAVAAFRQWLFIGAWGKFSSGSVWKTFARAVKHARKAGIVLPDDLRPYDLRHTFLSWLLEMTGGDIMAVKEYAQHADMRSTLRYVQRGASARMVAAIETVARTRGTAGRKSGSR